MRVFSLVLTLQTDHYTTPKVEVHKVSSNSLSEDAVLYHDYVLCIEDEVLYIN